MHDDLCDQSHTSTVQAFAHVVSGMRKPDDIAATRAMKVINNLHGSFTDEHPVHPRIETV